MRDSLFGAQSRGLLCDVCGKEHARDAQAADSPAAPTLESVSLAKKAARLDDYRPAALGAQHAAKQQLRSPGAKANATEAPGQLQRMLDEIRSIFDSQQAAAVVNAKDAVESVLSRYRLDRDEWAKYAFYEPHNYTRNLVDEHPAYNVMILSWSGGAKSRVHDHSGSHCFMKLLEGRLRELRFAWPRDAGSGGENGAALAAHGQQMRVIQTTEMRQKQNEILYINDSVGLHKVENVSDTETSATLHIYVPPYKSCKCFEENTGRAKECQVVYDSRGGKPVRPLALKLSDVN